MATDPTSVLFIQIIGAYLLVAGISGLLYPGRMRKIMAEFSRSKVLPYFDGFLALSIGLIIVLTQNSWDTLASSIVAVVGWLALIEAALMFLAPDRTVKQVSDWLTTSNVARTLGIVTVVAGAYLAYVGFLA